MAEIKGIGPSSVAVVVAVVVVAVVVAAVAVVAVETFPEWATGAVLAVGLKVEPAMLRASGNVFRVADVLVVTVVAAGMALVGVLRKKRWFPNRARSVGIVRIGVGLLGPAGALVERAPLFHGVGGVAGKAGREARELRGSAELHSGCCLKCGPGLQNISPHAEQRNQGFLPVRTYGLRSGTSLWQSFICCL